MVMRMQQAVVSMYEGGEQLRLTGPLSEWLFASKFWSDFNANHGTMFDQFEEDEADVLVVGAIVDALDEKMRALRKQEGHDVEFAYRWTSEHKPLTTSVPKELLLSELMTFRDFLAGAVAKNCAVTFAL